MAAGRRTRVLIVDDSAVMRSLLRTVVLSDAGLDVAGTAADGASALRSIESLQPDLVLLDVEMPVMDGLATLKQLRERGHRMPAIVCSALTRRGAEVTIEALAAGASDYVTKPVGQPSREAALQALAQELIPKIHGLAGRSPGWARLGFPGAIQDPLPSAPALLPAQPLSVQGVASTPSVLAIGVSTGGPAALDLLLPELPADFPVPILIVQHMPEQFTRLFAERLNSRCRLRVREGSEGEPVRAGTIYIARGDWHMEARPGALPGWSAALHLSQGPAENHCRPSVDVLFRSVARTYGARALAVVLTGMGYDGLAGCRDIRAQGGGVLVQDEATSTVWGMPGAVANAGLARKILPLNAIASEILRITRLTPAAAGEAAETSRGLPRWAAP